MLRNFLCPQFVNRIFAAAQDECDLPRLDQADRGLKLLVCGIVAHEVSNGYLAAI